MLALLTFANLSKCREYIDYILKEKLGPLYIGIPSLYKVFFKGIEGFKERNWPKSAEQNNILEWFNNLIKSFLGFIEEELKSNLKNINIPSQAWFNLGKYIREINKEQLRFNPTILTSNSKQYIKVRLILNELINRAPYGDTKTPLIIEDSKLLRGQDNNIFNIRKGLNITKVINYKLKSLIVPLSVARRSSSYTNAPLPPNKRLYLSSLIKRPIIQNRVH
ncbi:hypothetical protein V2W45_1470382 [Cenococcum geophilum]